MQTGSPAPSAKQQSLSSARLLNIIEYLAEKPEPERLTDIASALGMTQPTVLRYLKALITDGYAFQDETSGGYALTWKLCRAGDHLKSSRNLRRVISPYLQALSSSLNMGALLAQVQDGIILYLDVVGNPKQQYDSLLRIGKNAPIHTTGSGKILLSGMTDSQISRIIRTHGLAKLTENTITDPEELMAEVRRVRELGYAQDNEECEVDHSCVSIPVMDYTGNIIAAISVFDDAASMTEGRIRDSILPMLRETAKRISYRLGYEE